MIKNLILLIFIISGVSISYAQISFTSVTSPSTCSANGSISVNVGGGTAPYLYQIISSSTGVIRPAQNINVFQNLPAGSYNIRVTDRNNETVVNTAIISGNYLPLSFTAIQQQSTVSIRAINGKQPYTYAYSDNGGQSFHPLQDSNAFHCIEQGNYLFRVYDSCSNFYTETVVVAPVMIEADFSCVANTSNNTKSIVLNSLQNGNGGFTFRGFGVNYDQTNSTGNFYNINRCNKNISVEVRDRCNVSASYVVCPSPDYTFSVTCVNFKDRKVTMGNVSSGSGLPYQYVANDVASPTTTVQNFPIPGDSILAGLIDSCGFKNTIEVRRMKILYDNIGGCENGTLKLFTFYVINGKGYSFQPNTYTSISGPSTFNVTDTTTMDTSIVEIPGLQNGKYVYKITNACGDEVIDSFMYVRKCFKKITVRKVQNCSSISYKLEKDCRIDTNTVYTLTDLQGNTISQNTNGFFTGLNNDSCYKMKMHQLDCDTTVTDFINPIKPKLKLFLNACDVISLSVKLQAKKICGNALGSVYQGASQFILADSLFNVLLSSNSGYINPVPPNTYWIYAITDGCNSDTIRYTRTSGFDDSLAFCITPSVKVDNNDRCRIAWNVKIMNNLSNSIFTLTGNGVNLQGVKNFYGIDSGRYLVKNGCNQQELFLPSYYNFKTVVNPGCPSNASITASCDINTNYINSMAARYNFSVCDPPFMDYNIKEVGTNDPLIYNTSGIFNNLKTGTYYAVFFKGNENCNFYSDTIFTPFYTRPALTATYGLICNGNNASVKASVVGGTPPYTYEVLNTSIPVVITDSNYVLYNSLPLGTAQFRVNDACGISTDYSTEVLSVNFQPTFKKKCDGQVQLIAPDIFNTTYIWTNKNHDTIGTTPIVYTYPDGNDTFTVSIKHLTCSITKSLYVSDFSASIVNAVAGYDFASDTSVTRLQGNIPPLNAVGTWRQTDPSSGNTIFTNIHDAHSGISVDVFPGQYTYIWSITDTLIGCVDEDTVVVSFLRCPNIRPILFNKTIQNATCTNNGQIALSITQASTPVHFLWNTGDTSAVIKNLRDTTYIVTISDETSCTPDVMDTILITGTKPSFRLLEDTICKGDTLVVNNKNYFLSGIYTDTLLNRAGCDSILSIRLFILPTQDEFDTVRLCSNKSYTLPNGQIVHQSGSYLVNLSNQYGCDSVLHYTIISLPTNLIRVDTSICSGFSYTLPNGTNVRQSGIYTDTLTNTFGCDSIVLTNLWVKDSLRNLFLGNDTSICDGDKLLLNPGLNGVKYLWQNGSAQHTFTVDKEGVYYVEISDACTSLSDTIHVSTGDCSCTFYIPNAFSPNNDGYNDIFKPIVKCAYFKQYSFLIYDRWGELLFQSNDTDLGWDGIFKNQEQAMDNYLWSLSYYDVLNNKQVYKKGTLTLMK